ncbi:MAG TPA: hypothetical protein VGK14_10210 [Novimethylophilus sp.]|jgi:hypothetical protein|uniref:hypothetical protein n=1 Tax=Novimethylophilus sp. TaxID=2137426 RepID=UPI002F4024DF
MCISLDTLNEIELSLAEFRKLTQNPLVMLKGCFPELSFVHMSASDIPETPFRSLPDYNLYLLDGREHCVQLTSDPAHATGIVVAHR